MEGGLEKEKKGGKGKRGDKSPAWSSQDLGSTGFNLHVDSDVSGGQCQVSK